MSVEFDRESPGKFDSRTLSRETLSRWTGRIYIYIYIYMQFLYPVRFDSFRFRPFAELIKRFGSVRFGSAGSVRFLIPFCSFRFLAASGMAGGPKEFLEPGF